MSFHFLDLGVELTAEENSDDISPFFEAENVTMVSSETVGCDGFDALFGHPKIYLSLPLHTKIKCPYCSRFFLRVSAV